MSEAEKAAPAALSEQFAKPAETAAGHEFTVQATSAGKMASALQAQDPEFDWDAHSRRMAGVRRFLYIR